MPHRLVRTALAWGLVLVASLTPAALRAQSVFRPVAAGKEPQVVQQLQLRASIDQRPVNQRPVNQRHVDLRLVAGGLIAVVDGKEQAVPSTATDGTGVCHALTLEPNGRVVVAAANGLFVLDAEHLITDPMDVEDGLPAGEPRGVAADEKNRVWLCTEADFAVVDARFGYTRSFDRAQLPPGPFDAVVAMDARVYLRAAGKWFVYRPDSGPAPRHTSGKVVKGSLEADTTGRVAIDLDVQANGGATLRHRRHHHHRLYAVRDNIVDGLRPGKHVVEVLGVDRDLRSALVARYDVHAPLPPQFSTKLLPLIAAAGLGLVLLLAWPRRGRRRKRRALLRAGVFSVIALQLIAATMGYGRSWPFVGFSMYTENYYEGSVLYKPRLRGIYPDGSMEQVGFRQAGIIQDDSWQMLSELAHGNEQGLEKALRKLNRRRRGGAKQRGKEPPQDFVGIEIADTRTRLTVEGPYSVAPTVIVRWTK